MQREASIGSWITWFVIAATLLVAMCLVGLQTLPVFEGVFTEMRMPLPGFTRLVFAVGPGVLVSVGVIAASLMVMGEFKPALRGIRTPLVFLVAVLLGFALAAMFMPRLECGEITSPGRDGRIERAPLPSLRDWHRFHRTPSAEALGYSRSSLRD